MAVKDDLNLNTNAKNEEEAAAAPGGKRKWIILLLALLLVTGGGAAAWLFLGADDAATEGEEAVVEPAAPAPEPIYLGMERFTVNFDYQGRIRYVQADMQLMAHSQDIIDKAEKNMPAVRNRLIMLLSDQDFEALRKVEGKEALRAAVRDAVNEALDATGDDVIKDVFFTSFVLQ